MSQKSVEILLGKILTDECFRQSFFPIQSASFELAATQGLELTAVERSALSTLRRRRFEYLAQCLDPRISRCADSEAESVSREAAGVKQGSRELARATGILLEERRIEIETQDPTGEDAFRQRRS